MELGRNFPFRRVSILHSALESCGYATVGDLVLVAAVAFLTWLGNSQAPIWKFKV